MRQDGGRQLLFDHVHAAILGLALFGAIGSDRCKGPGAVRTQSSGGDASGSSQRLHNGGSAIADSLMFMSRPPTESIWPTTISLSVDLLLRS